jgi:hypothetical protein
MPKKRISWLTPPLVFEIRESYRARKGGMDVILHCAAADANRPHDKSFEKKNIASFRLTTALQKDKGFSITNPQQLLPLAKVTVEAHALDAVDSSLVSILALLILLAILPYLLGFLP